MAKQLNVKLNFSADTKQAEQALTSLTQHLNSISNLTPTAGTKLSNDLQLAKKSAQELQQHLINAYNVKTGNLDLNKLDASLKSSGQNLGQLSSNLLKAGSTGEQAFMNIQKAIGNASVQINQANGLLSQFWTTLKNTARWQLSSSILHGFIGGLQSAWGYAKDLDESLNNIRIVTGYSSDKMAEFAESANKAAKALSTTTTKYTDAALIYYQQGLSDAEVAKRTEVTIKMANAAGQSAQIVSDQLTSIWNNFYDGSKSLEYYADVMTALGAATASSTDEIAGGLEKFAAIGETIGLSYEYAASALATITSNTRQSEEVVGTALKTIFARIQGLNLGETLDDGVTLNKYSAALESVGISIFDQQGELKKMDSILDEMGEKWDTLNKAQQTALAQTVAGVRQYTQLVALMENWDKNDSDSMKANLATAYGSEGALQEQADIYADSWDAAMDRVKSSAEGIYQDLFPTEELTGLADGFAVFLEGIDGIIQGLGGLQGVLLLISSIVLNTFKNQIGSTIDNLISSIGGGLANAVKSIGQAFTNAKGESIGFVGNVKGIKGALEQVVGLSNSSAVSAATLSNKMTEVANATGNVKKQSALMDQNLTSGVSGMLEKSMELSKVVKDTGGAYGQYNTNMMEINNTQAIIEQSAKHLTSEQQTQLALLQEQAQVANEQVYAAQQLVEAEEKRAQIAANQAGSHIEDMDRFVEDEKTGVGFKSSLLSTQGNQQVANDMLGLFKEMESGWDGISDKVSIYGKHLGVAFDDTVDIVAVNKKANSTYGIMSKKLAEIEKTGKTMGKDSDAYRAKLKQVSTELQAQEGFAGAVARKYLAGKDSVEEIEKGIQNAANATSTFAKLTGSSEGDISRINGAMQQVVDSTYNAGVAAENFKNKMSQVGQTLQNALSGALSFGHVLSSMVGGFSSIAMGINAVSNAMDTLGDEDASFTSKLTAGAMAATMSVRGLMTVLGGAKTFIKSYQTAMAAKNAIDLASKAATDANAKAQLENLLVTKLGVSEDEKAAAAKALVTVAQANDTAATITDTGANWANVASQMAKFWWISLIIAAVALLVGGIIALASSYETVEEKAAKAKETQEQCAEALDNAKEAAEALADSWDKYDDAVEKLKECTKGTEEWEEALRDVNDAALEVLKNLPDDLSADEIKSLYNEEGFLDEEKIKGYQNHLNENVRIATVAEANASKEVSELKIQVDLKRDIQDLIEAGALGASYNTYDNRGNVTGTSYLGLNADMSSETIMDNLDTLANLDFETFKERLSKLGVSLHNVSSEDLLTFQQQVNAAASSAEGAAEKMKLIVGIQIDDKYSGNLTGSEKTGVTEITDELAEDYRDYYREILTSNKTNLSSKYKTQYKEDYGHDYGGISKGGNETNQVFKDIMEDAALYGLDWEIGDKNAVQGDDSNRKLSLVVDGKDAELYSASWVAKQLGAARAMYETDASLESVQAILSSLNKVDPSGALAGMMADGTVSVDNLQDLNKVTDEDLGAKIQEIYTGLDKTGKTAFLQAYDVESINTLITKVNDQVGNLQELKTKLQSFNIGDTNLLDFGIDNQMSLEATQELYNTLSNIEQIGTGNISSEDFVKNLSEMINGIEDPQKKAEALNKLASIDWTSWNAMDQAAVIVEEFGGSIDLADEKWIDFADDVRKATLSFPEYDNLKNTLQEISGIVDDLDFGSIIDEEDYERLIEYNAALKDLFIMQADGTRVFIGDSELMRETTEANLLAMRQDMELRKQRAELIKEIEAGNVFGVTDEDTSYSFSALDIDTRWGDGKDGVLSATNSNVKNYWGRTEDFASGQEAMNWALAAEGKQAWDSDAIRAVLEEQGYDEAEWNALIEAAKQGSTEGLQAALDFLSQYINEDFEKADTEIKEMTAMTAESIDELNQLLEDGLIDEEQYHKAFELVDKKEIENLDIDYEVYENLAESIEASGNAIQGLSKDLKGNKTEARDVAKQIMRYDKAVQSINESYEDWEKTLKSGNLQDQAEIVDDLREAYGNLFDIEGSSLSDGFVRDAENLKLMQEAAKGSEEAYDSLMLKVQNDIIAQCDLDTTKFDAAKAALDVAFDELNFTDLEIGANLNSAGALQAMTDLVNAANMTADQATTYLASMGVDAEVVEDTTTSQDEKTYVAAKPRPYYSYAYGTNPTTGVMQRYAFVGTTYDLQTQTVPESKETTAVGLKVISANKSSGGNFKHLSSSHGSGTKAPSKDTGGGGGSTSKPEKMETRDTTKQGDVIERYRQITDSIDNVTDALTRAERATNRLWGKDKLDAMRQENKILAEQYKLLQQKAKEAEDYAKQDYNDLMDAADEIGVSVVVDTATGDITNIEDVEKTLYNRLAAAEAEYSRKVEAYNAAVDAAGDSPTEAKVKELEAMKDALDAYERDIIGGIENDISAWEDAEQTFQNSVETWEDAGLEAEEILDQMMQKNFDIWSESLQLEVEVNDKDLELLDYYLSKIEDNVYEMAEAAALMVGNLNSGFEGGQLGEYLDNLSIYGEKYAELTDRLNSTDPEYQITSAQYKEGLEEIQSGLLDNLSSVQELDTAMMEYYGETLSMVGEEIDKYSEKMEHQTSILEHYATMMDILGKSQDYEAMGTILEGQVKTIQNELDVAEAEYNLYAEEAEKKRQLYEDAVARGDAAAAELYKGEWEAAEEAAMEAQSNMLDKTEQWAEAMKAVVENKLQGLAKSLEEALTGGTSFDQINTQLERAASLQEEYLTTTNQIYETNKLMRTAQQEMDKSTNSVAKQRLKDFIKETNQLQDKSKLSKYELEIQQAKYDLLLAEMALEDAQNAKTTVRLQRDSEGNMGYVYTADQNQLSQAQQQLEDAQNSLYNIGLEGANNYTEKYNQTMQEMYDTLTSISEAYYNGEIASREEYEEQMLAAQEYYYEQLENFQDLYGVALQTDTRVIKDAWSTGMGAMKVETRAWKDAVSKYTGEATATLVGWYDKVDEIAAKTGLDNIANKVNNVTKESQNLKDTILGVDGDKGVIGALKDELIAVGDLTGGYANLRTTIQGLITDYEKLMKTVNNAQNQQQSDQDKNESGNGGNSGDTGTDNNPNGTTSGSGDAGDTTPNTTPGNETPSIAQGQNVTVKTSATHFSRDGGNGTRMRSFVPGSTYTVMNFDDDEVMIGRNGVVTGWVKKTDLVGFDTGGYTGSWGSYGKMAMLHEKELVLNEGDTSNFLASMEVLERILEVIDLQSMNAQLGGLLNTPSFGNNNTSQTIEQNVRIEASFPGVSDRNEIEEAFNNLINTASQYANRKF